MDPVAHGGSYLYGKVLASQPAERRLPQSVLFKNVERHVDTGDEHVPPDYGFDLVGERRVTNQTPVPAVRTADSQGEQRFEEPAKRL